MLGMLLFMPGICFSKETSDSILLNKIWSYRRNFAHKIGGENPNVYIRYTINTERRNFTLFLIPSFFYYAQGQREFLSETYGKLRLLEENDYRLDRQVVSNTEPHGNEITDAFTDYIVPDVYGMTIYKDKILSPFYRKNRRYYRYTIQQDSTNIAQVSFQPFLRHTQLIKGNATVDVNTGRIISVIFDGEFDMIKFHVDIVHESDGSNSVLPLRCQSDLKFNFLGNRITSHFLAIYNCKETLPDSVRNVSDKAKMDSLRPVVLRKDEEEIYQRFYQNQEKQLVTAIKTDTIEADVIENDTIEATSIETNVVEKDTTQKENLVKKEKSVSKFFQKLGERMISSTRLEKGDASFRLSPILNPQYISYSKSRGLSYRIQLGARYSWNKNRYLTLTPRIGYNFKIKQFFHHTSLRMTYNPKRKGYAEIIVANGNRIYNSSVVEAIKNQPNATPEDYEGKDLDYFKDHYIKVHNNIQVFDWLNILGGVVYHIRRAVNESGMEEENMPTVYKSFAPYLTLQFTPWRKGPVLTFNYEHSYKGIFGSNLQYERIETDASYKFKLDRMRLLNLRAGFGLYTNRKTAFFLDYTNFHDQNLPEGWDDDWTGQFQLIDSRWYNISKYYVRGHVSYESPLLVCSFFPIIGRYVETERLYLSVLSIQHTRPYSELGYAVSTRFVSIGAFASFLRAKIQEVGFKFTFELFRDW